MFDIGGVTMMEAMVNCWFNFSEPSLLISISDNECLQMQLCCFDLQNIQTVAGSEDMWGLLLKVIFIGPILSPASTFTTFLINQKVNFNFFSFSEISTSSGGGFKICPLKSRSGRPRTQVQHLMQIDLKGWFLNYSTSFQYHSLLQILNCVSGTDTSFLVP